MRAWGPLPPGARLLAGAALLARCDIRRPRKTARTSRITTPATRMAVSAEPGRPDAVPVLSAAELASVATAELASCAAAGALPDVAASAGAALNQTVPVRAASPDTSEKAATHAAMTRVRTVPLSARSTRSFPRLADLPD